MKVLHVIPGLTHERGGPSAVVQALVRRQTEAGHRVTVLTTDQGARYGEQPVALADGVALERLRVRGPDRIAYAPGFAAAARALLRTHDVANVHSLFTYPVHVTLREALRVGTPVVLRPCGLLHRYSLRRSALRKALYLRAWGRLIRKACAAWHYTSVNEAAESWPWDDSPRFVVPNGIEPDEFAVDREAAREAVAARWPQLGKSLYVLFLGRLHPKKGLDFLVEAFLSSAPHPIKLVVAGPDEEGLWAPVAARLLARASAAERVVRVGTVVGADKTALLAGAALFALPSQHENFGIAALEALAAGTPVLLSPHVDLAEAAATAGLGQTAPLQADVWHEHLAALREQPGPDEVGRARAWVRAHYSWEPIARDLVEHYRWVRAGCPARRTGNSCDPVVSVLP